MDLEGASAKAPLVSEPASEYVKPMSSVGGVDDLSLPPSEVFDAVRSFLPSAQQIAEDLVELKKAHPSLLQRSALEESLKKEGHNVFNRYLDHNVVATCFLRRLRERAIQASSFKSMLADFRRTMRAAQNKADLLRTIETVDQMAEMLRSSDGDLFKYLHTLRTSCFQKCSFLVADHASMLSYTIIDNLCRVILLMIVVGENPHSMFVMPPLPEYFRCTQGPYWLQPEGKECATVGDLPRGYTLPLHPEWMHPEVNPFEYPPYFLVRDRWTKNHHYVGTMWAAGSHESVQVNSDRFLVVNTLLTSTLGELRTLADQATNMQNKVIGMGITLATTLANLIVNHFTKSDVAAGCSTG